VTRIRLFDGAEQLRECDDFVDRLLLRHPDGHVELHGPGHGASRVSDVLGRASNDVADSAADKRAGMIMM
jgi:hypothetical protein